MKCNIQQRLMEEYKTNARPGESYLQYMQRTNQQNARVHELRQSLGFSSPVGNSED
jgi:hypothetical protein